MEILEQTNRKLKTYIANNREYIKEAFHIAWPSVLESFFVALAGMVDSLMVSAIGAYAVAAVGLTTQPKFIMLILFIAMNVAVSAIVARRRGQEDRKGANEVFLVTLICILAAGMILSILGVCFADPIIRLCGSNEETHDSAVAYFRIIAGGMMFNIISLGINAAQRGSGRTKITMKTNVTSNVVNMIGNYLLIEGHFGFPAMGIQGAAIATVFGTVVACVMSIRSVMSMDTFVSIPYIIKEKIKPSLEPLQSMIHIASNIFAEQILIRIGFLAVAVMAANMGTAAFAAHQVGMNVMSLSFSFGDGMQAAAVALIGRSLGEQKPEQAKTYGAICQRMGNIISIIVSIFYLTCGRSLYHLYFQEEEIIAIGVQIMQVMVFVVIFQIAQVIYMGCLRGAGDVKFTMVASMISIIFIRAGISYLMCYVFGMGIMGIWLGTLADQFCRFLLTTWRFKSGVWTKMKV